MVHNQVQMQGKSMLIVAFGIVCGWLSIAAHGQQSIDATVPPKKLHWNTEGGSGGSAGRSIPLLVEVRAIGVPDATGKAKVEFILTNTGVNKLNIPVSPQLADLEPADPKVEYTVTHLGLFITEASRAKVLQGGADLYGKPDAALSLISLSPGHRIRVLAIVGFQPISEAVKGTLSFRAGAIEDYELFKKREGRRALDSQEIGASFSKEFTAESLFFVPDSDVGTGQARPR